MVYNLISICAFVFNLATGNEERCTLFSVHILLLLKMYVLLCPFLVVVYTGGVWWCYNQGELNDDNFLVIFIRTPLDLQLWSISSWCTDKNRFAKKDRFLLMVKKNLEKNMIF